MAATKSSLQRLFTWLWRRPWFRRLFYNSIGLAFRGQQNWRMMNCGWADPGHPLPSFLANEELNRALYLRVVGDTPLTDRRVLEVGAGRGGGCSFLHERFRPSRMAGLDYAGASARWCQRHFSRPGLEFHAGDALHTPFPAASFDAVICVELTHCVPDKPAFLREMTRVLAPGGTLLVADFFYRRPDAAHALGKFQEAIATSDFVLLAEEDLTAGVLSAMRADGARRDEMIKRSVPRPFQKVAHYFGGTTESSTYTGLAAGRAVYLRFALRRKSMV